MFTTNIYLIGFRGSGKTTIGKILSKKLKYNFSDTDFILEKKYNSTISKIIKNKGWEYFRKIECHILKKVSNFRNVISTGGGIILKEENIKFMRNHGKIFFLNVKLKTLVERLSIDPKKTQRPKIIQQKISLFEETKIILSNRLNLYKKASHIIINANKNIGNIIHQIIISL